jgi:hypothetical protein
MKEKYKILGKIQQEVTLEKSSDEKLASSGSLQTGIPHGYNEPERFFLHPLGHGKFSWLILQLSVFSHSNFQLCYSQNDPLTI